MKLLLTFVLLLSSLEVFATTTRASLDRYWLMHDRVNTDDLMRPYKRDYFRLNVDAALSADFQDFADEVTEAIDNNSNSALEAAVEKYKNTEHFVKADVGLGIWLPGWNMGEVEALPSLRAEVSVGGLLTANGSSIDLSSYCAEYGIPAADCPSSSTSSLFLDAYVQGTGKVGFDIELSHENKWKSDIYLYGMVRTDQIKALDAATAATQTEDIDFNADETKTTTANLDFNIGFDDGTSKFFAGVYELRLKEIEGDDDRKSEVANARPLYVGNSPLYRAHAERKFEFLATEITPFAGVHYREQYKLDDGYYAGLKLLWGWRALHFALTGMYDPQYITTTLRTQLGIVDIEGTAKTPHEEKDDYGIELASIYAVNFRFHF